MAESTGRELCREGQCNSDCEVLHLQLLDELFHLGIKTIDH